MKVSTVAMLVLASTCFAMQSQQQSASKLRLRIVQILFEGNRVFSQQELRSQMKLVCQAGLINSIIGCDVYSRERLNEDLARVKQFLEDRGYIRSFIGEPKIEYVNPADAARSAGEARIRVIIPIAEGSLHRLESLTVIGGTLMPDDKARAQFDIKPGDVLRASLIEQAVARLRSFYGRFGYLQFSPSLNFRFASGTGNETLVDLQVTLVEGRQYKLGRLDLHGDLKTNQLLIRRMIPLEEGEVFDYSKWEQGIQNLNRSGLFDRVSPRDVAFNYDEAGGIVNVELHLRERKHQRIDVSAGGGTVGGASVGFDYSNLNLTGRADKFSARLRIGNRERSFTIDYSTVTLTRLPLRVDLGGYYQRLKFVDARSVAGGQFPLFIQRTLGASAGLSLPILVPPRAIDSPTRVGLYYSFTSTNLLDVLGLTSVALSEIEQGGIRIASLTPLVLHDSLDRLLDPRLGKQLILGAEVSARAIGGSLNTVRPFVDFRQFFPLTHHQRLELGEAAEPRVIALRMRFARIVGFGKPFQPQVLSSVDGVPIFKRFFLGGETEVRGYEVNSIAPMARVERFLIINGGKADMVSSNIQPIGGDTEFIFNVEYRVPIVWRVWAAAFFDFGSSFNTRRLREQRAEELVRIQPLLVPATLLTVLRPLEAGQVRLPNYRASLGGELRFLIPVINLPLRLIFAANPNAQKQPPDPTLIAPEKRFAFRFGFSRTV
jgi:outer membrane protein insertion porin family